MKVRLVQLGMGGVGHSLLRQLLDCAALHQTRLGLRIQVVAVCDSRGVLLDAEGISREVLEDAMRLKQEGNDLTQLEQTAPNDGSWRALSELAAPDCLFVDCTAADETAPLLISALEKGAGAVLANKKPLTAEQSTYERIAHPRARSRWESTVGSGVPVIAAMRRLIESGDSIERIEGATSGTLGRLMTGLEDSVPFSRLLGQAHREGATEPDPRDDLSGEDAARKALILARGMGMRIDLKDVRCQSLYPPAMDQLSVEEFLNRAPSLDEGFSSRCRQAWEQGLKLRYRLEVSRQSCSAGLAAVEPSSPLANLRGNDNLIQFHTRWYRKTPLVLQGRGEGVHATAAGVLSDIVDLARLD